jgi:hypothetical protein
MPLPVRLRVNWQNDESKKLTIVSKWHKAFLKTDKVTPYVHGRGA